MKELECEANRVKAQLAEEECKVKQRDECINALKSTIEVCGGLSVSIGTNHTTRLL